MKNAKLKKLLNGAVATTMAMSLFMGGGMMVKAADGDAAKTSTATFTKVLQMADGTTTPKADFKFTFTKTEDSPTDTPAIAEKTLSTAGGEAGTVSDGMKSVTIESANIFAGITFPHAGEYVYTMKEKADTYTIADADKESMTYSAGSYEMHVYVVNDEVNGGTKIEAVGTVIEVKDNEDQTAGSKVDSTPSADGSGNNVTFTNTYIKKNGGTDPVDPADQSLKISKTVAGTYGDKTKAFDFYVKMGKAATATGTTCTGTILNADDTTARTQTFTYGTTATVKLTHGQKLVFVDLPVGTTYVASEKKDAGYVQTAVLKTDGLTIDVTTTTAAISSGEHKIGEQENSFAVTNTADDVPITGILVNNLPFIMMIVVAMGIFAAFVAKKRNKNMY